ncbi:MAG: BatA domain-containing protein, partial [Planctomycetota bacterium]
SLSFLYPLCWFGAIALAAPIWLHLRRRSEQRVISFSALRFLDDQPQPQASPLRIRQPLLLVLRLLALLAIIAAFTWPFIPSDRTMAVTISQVYLLDSTLSNRAVNRAGNRWQTDREQLLSAIRQAPATTQIAVVELRATPQVVVDWSTSRAAALAAVEQLEPTYERGSYQMAFRLAESLLARSLGSEHEITLLGDSQENQWTEEQTGTPFLSPRKIHLPTIAADALPNVALFAPRLQRVFLGDRARVECTVRLARYGELKQAELRVNVPGQFSEQRQVKFDQDEDEVQIELSWEALPTAGVRGELTITAPGDSLPDDDHVYFGLPPVKPGRVLCLARSSYLRAALSPDVMSGRWTSEVRDEPPWDSNPTTALADALIVESHYLTRPEARDLTQEYLRQGLGVLLLVDQLNPCVQAFLRDQGLDTRSVVEQSPAPAELRYVHAQHPIFRPFRSPDFGNLLDVRFYRHRRLALGDAVPLAFSQTGDPLMMQVVRGRGCLLVMAFGLEREDTNWPLKISFVPFLDLCLQRIRAQSTLPTDALPGEACIWSVAAEGPLTLQRLSLPSQKNDSHDQAATTVTPDSAVVVQAPVESGRVEFTAPEKPGLYAVSLDGGQTKSHLLQVNPAIEESVLAYAAGDSVLDSWRRPDLENATAPSTTQDSTFALTRAEIMRQTVWWWLLAAGTVALFIESWWLLRPMKAIRS